MKNAIAHTTNYQSLIALCTECDESGNLASWQQHRPDNATYTSTSTSVEMIQAAGQYFDEKTMQSLTFSQACTQANCKRWLRQCTYSDCVHFSAFKRAKTPVL